MLGSLGALSCASQTPVELKHIHAQSREKRRQEKIGEARRARKGLISSSASVEDAGRGSESAGSIFSSPRLFSFRRTFGVQQQSAGMLLQTGFMWKCLRTRPRLLSPLLRAHTALLICRALLRTHAQGRKLTLPPNYKKNTHVSTKAPVLLTICTFYIQRLPVTRDAPSALCRTEEGRGTG